MTSEEVNRAIEFLIQHSAEVSVQIAEMTRGLKDFRESTLRFQTWATEVVAIQSSRLDENDRFHRDALKRMEQNDQLHQDALDFQRQALHLLQRILDKLP